MALEKEPIVKKPVDRLACRICTRWLGNGGDGFLVGPSMGWPLVVCTFGTLVRRSTIGTDRGGRSRSSGGYTCRFYIQLHVL